MRVWDAAAHIIKLEGAEQLFCFPSSPLIDACATLGLRPYVCRQERVGLGMADGFARVTAGRRLSVFAMQSGPGSENAFPGLATAFADSTPVLVIPMGLPKERASLQPNFDSARAFGGVTKSFERVSAPELLIPVLRRAIHALRSGRAGPAVVEIPGDVGQLDAGDISAYRQVPWVRATAAQDDLDRAAAAFLRAERPLIMAGAGILLAEASSELRALAELLDAPVVTTTGGKSAFPEDHELSLGATGLTMGDHALAFIEDCDLVFATGASLTRGSTVTANLPPGKVLIHNTNDPRDIGKSYFVDHALLGDARLVLAQLLDAVKDRLSSARARATGAAIGAARQRWLDDWQPRLRSEAVPINPYRVISDFMLEVDPAGAIVTHDAGGPRDQLLPFYRASTPHGYLGWGKSHALGTGVGLTMGAKLAAPEKLCVHFMGDAAFGMTGLDLETAVRTGLPTLSIVFKNSTMAVERNSLARSQELYRARDLGGDYADIARALGLYAERVDQPGEILPALRRAREATESGRAALLEFITADETDFSNFQALSK
jgi:acetolactate synthase-1/2/3 large subunit